MSVHAVPSPKSASKLPDKAEVEGYPIKVCTQTFYCVKVWRHPYKVISNSWVLRNCLQPTSWFYVVVVVVVTLVGLPLKILRLIFKHPSEMAQ